MIFGFGLSKTILQSQLSDEIFDLISHQSTMAIPIGLISGMIVFALASRSTLSSQRFTLSSSSLFSKRLRYLSWATACLMFTCVLFIAMLPTPRQSMAVHQLTGALFIFSIGVGGEYPISSSIAAFVPLHAKSTSAMSLSPSSRVAWMFTMQAVGVYFNSLVISVEYLFRGDNLSWRGNFTVGALLLLIVLQLRIFRYLGEFEEESKRERTAANKLINDAPVTPPPSKTTPLTAATFRPSLNRPSNLILTFGTSVSWFLWDIIFYSTKIHQDAFLATLADTLGSQLFLGHTVALVAMGGAFTGAWLVGRNGVGVKKLQVYGSAVVGFSFLCLSRFELGSGSPASKITFIVVSCLGQFVNVSTFVISAVSFDEENRTLSHGISASAGKLGALLGVYLMGVLTVRQGYAMNCVASFLITLTTFKLL